MPFSVLVSAIASALLLPPANSLLLCAAGLLLRRRWRRSGTLLALLGAAMLLVLSTRAGAMLLVRPLEDQYPPLAAAGDAQAIVILGASRLSNAPEYGHDDETSMVGLKRLQYGAYLQRKTGLPILVSGGNPDGSPESEAALMARTLRRDLGAEVRWEEGRSNTTYDNAVMSAGMLKAAGIDRILLVTDAIHMPRSMRAFAGAGLNATPAPTLFTSTARARLTDYFPAASNLQLSSYAMREWIGQLWYRIR
ncbi:YdcF family protein [Herbaspirillum sp.]|uniref:YdcF family protein n=1 Tax=Herbaspirillum sp. TaxID=1890675 RepID=UPI001AFD75FF|nr:YdcF family protein [Herbaspirillum sp.]MBO9538352.1 YdcF family protein [Herbaspirillum sp.]